MVRLVDILLTLRTFLVGGKLFRESMSIGPAGLSSVGLGRLSPPAADSFADLDTGVWDDLNLSCKRLIHVARMPSPTGADDPTQSVQADCMSRDGRFTTFVGP